MIYISVSAGASVSDLLIKNASGVTIAPDVTYGANVSVNSSGGFVFSTASGDGIAYFGPMIFFE
jgi:hypothetical protein